MLRSCSHASPVRLPRAGSSRRAVCVRAARGFGGKRGGAQRSGAEGDRAEKKVAEPPSAPLLPPTRERGDRHVDEGPVEASSAVRLLAAAAAGPAAVAESLNCFCTSAAAQRRRAASLGTSRRRDCDGVVQLAGHGNRSRRRTQLRRHFDSSRLDVAQPGGCDAAPGPDAGRQRAAAGRAGGEPPRVGGCRCRRRHRSARRPRSCVARVPGSQRRRERAGAQCLTWLRASAALLAVLTLWRAWREQELPALSVADVAFVSLFTGISEVRMSAERTRAHCRTASAFAVQCDASPLRTPGAAVPLHAAARRWRGLARRGVCGRSGRRAARQQRPQHRHGNVGRSGRCRIRLSRRCAARRLRAHGGARARHRRGGAPVARHPP
jgi:hypothetical protein